MAISFFGEPHIGYFLSDKLAVRATGFFGHQIDGGVSSPYISFGGAYSYVNYHFSSGSPLSPYIGCRIGAFKDNVINPNLEMQFALGAQTGLQYFVTGQVSINGELEIATSTGSGGVIYLSCLGFGLSYHIK